MLRALLLSTHASELAETMSEISEDRWCAGWMDGLEFDLWDELNGSVGRTNYGITEDERAELKRLSDLCGGWIIFDKERGEVWLPLPVWKVWYKSNRPAS